MFMHDSQNCEDKKRCFNAHILIDFDHWLPKAGLANPYTNAFLSAHTLEHYVYVHFKQSTSKNSKICVRQMLQ